MNPLERLESVEKAVEKLLQRLNDIEKRLEQGYTTPTEAKPVSLSGKWAIEVPDDEDLLTWGTVRDMGTGTPIAYDTEEDAKRAGASWGIHRVKRLS